MGRFANEVRNPEGLGLPPVKTEGTDGFNALGKPVPFYRRSEAFRHAMDMGCTDKQKVFRCIEAMANRIERDDPHGAMERALGGKQNPDGIVDATGVYRLLAVLLTATKPKVRVKAMRGEHV
jgi:hypothetical protein